MLPKFAETPSKYFRTVTHTRTQGAEARGGHGVSLAWLRNVPIRRFEVWYHSGEPTHGLKPQTSACYSSFCRCQPGAYFSALAPVSLLSEMCYGCLGWKRLAHSSTAPYVREWLKRKQAPRTTFTTWNNQTDCCSPKTTTRCTCCKHN